MFTSLGIDNFELRYAITKAEAEALKRCCSWWRGGVYALLGKEEPLITLRFSSGVVIANLNAPKICSLHNVKLATPEMIRDAIRALAINTAKAVPRLDWLNAEVSSVHITFTCETSDFEMFAKLSKAPRGAWEDTEFYPNIYFNSKRTNTPALIYDKAKNLRDAGKSLPSDVIKEMDCTDNSIFRFEVRLDQLVLSNLKKHGKWEKLSILAQDLATANGFRSALLYLLWRFDRHFPLPVIRKPTLRPNPTARAYASYNTRETANENPSRLKDRLFLDHKSGIIDSIVFRNELARIQQLEAFTNTGFLRSILLQEIAKLTSDNGVILGDIRADDIEYAARTH